MSEEKDKVELVSSGTPQKEFKPAEPAAAPSAAPKQKPTSGKAEPIVPQKRAFKWYTPVVWARDFVVGTVQGFGDGLSIGAKRGLKIGMLVALAAFMLPTFAPELAVAALELGLPNIAAAGAGIQFIPNGLGFFGGVLAYGLGGAAIGATVTGALGLATGGLYEIKLNRNREKYAEEFGGIAGAAKGHKTLGPSRFQQYETLYDRLENRSFLRNFELDQDRYAQQGSWVGAVEASRSGNGYDRGV